MEVGMNLALDGDTKAGIVDLINRCAATNIKSLRITVGMDFDPSILKAAYKAIKQNAQQVYLVPEAVIHAPAQADVVERLFKNPHGLMDLYDAIFDPADPKLTMGVGFVDRFYLATQSQEWVKRGIPIVDMISMNNQVAKKIRKFGVPVVMPLLRSDMHGSDWTTKVDFDVFDIENFHDRGDVVMVGDVHAEKPVWIGTAGLNGGHVFPTLQARWLDQYKKEVGDRVEYIFLYSRRGVPNFDWRTIMGPKNEQIGGDSPT